MKAVSVDSQKMLESLKTAVNKALEKKKRLGQYAVVWSKNKPVIIKGAAMNTIEVKKMNTIERLQAMEILWDALLHEEVEIESPGWHQGIIEKRMAKIADGNAKFLSLQELKARQTL